MKSVLSGLVLAMVLGGIGTLWSQQPAANKKADLSDYARKNAGDPAQGVTVYRNVGCVSCHLTPGKGGSVGPDLNCIGEKYDREALMKKILEPRQGSAMPTGFDNVLSGPDFANLLAYLESTCAIPAQPGQ